MRLGNICHGENYHLSARCGKNRWKLTVCGFSRGVSKTSALGLVSAKVKVTVGVHVEADVLVDVGVIFPDGGETDLTSFSSAWLMWLLWGSTPFCSWDECRLSSKCGDESIIQIQNNKRNQPVTLQKIITSTEVLINLSNSKKMEDEGTSDVWITSERRYL